VVFGINAVAYLAVVAALLMWHRPAAAAGEPLLPALRAGIRYVICEPGVRRIMLRALVFVLPASALWGLLPVAAVTRLGLGSAG
jgi:hypothetical protein